MHSYLITGKSNQLIEKDINTLVQKLGTKHVDIAVTNMQEAKEFIKFTKFINSSKNAFVIRNIDSMTVESANSLLKTLEEPGINTYFILTCFNIHKVLPTIISRCVVLYTKDEGNKHINSLKVDNLSDFLESVSEIKERPAAISLMENVIRSIQLKLISGNDKAYYANLLDRANISLTNMQANGNVKIQLISFCSYFR